MTRYKGNPADPSDPVNYPAPSLTLAASFNVMSGTFASAADGEAAVAFLDLYGVPAEVSPRNDGADGFRVTVPAIGQIFWPGTAVPAAWSGEADNLRDILEGS